MKKTNAQSAARKKGYIVTGVLAAALLLLAAMPLGVSAASDYDYQAIEEFEQPDEFASLDVEAAFDQMLIDAFAYAGITPLSDNRVTWKPHEPVITVPIGQDFVYIYFTLYRPGGVATPMETAMTTMQLIYREGAFEHGGTSPLGSFNFTKPVISICTCCWSLPDPPFVGQIGPTTHSVYEGYEIFGAIVGQLFLMLPGWQIGGYYGEIEIRVRLSIPPESPVNNPEIGYHDITVRRGGFSAGGIIFGNGYSTVRIVREVPTPHPHQIAFHIYTGNQRLIDMFGYYGTPNADGIQVVNVPVTPGTPHSEWPNQDILNAVFGIGHVNGVAGVPGHAFWGWFRDETLNASGRFGRAACSMVPNPTNPGLRRPSLADRCEWMNNRVDRGPQYRIFDLLQNPSITQAQIDDLFGSDGTLDLFGIWSIWGDIDDDDKINFTTLGNLQAYLLFRYSNPNIIDLNRRAADVYNDGDLNWTDFSRLQSYLLTRDTRPGFVILGVRSE